MSNLFDIEKELYELLENGFNDECIDQETGEIFFDKAQVFIEQLQGDRISKIENIALYCQQLRADASEIKAKEDVLEKRRKAKEKKAEWLEDSIKQSLLSNGDKRIETSKIYISFRKSVSVNVFDVNQLDKEYLVVDTRISPDKKALSAALKLGIKIPGAELIENQNLQIK